MVSASVSSTFFESLSLLNSLPRVTSGNVPSQPFFSASNVFLGTHMGWSPIFLPWNSYIPCLFFFKFSASLISLKAGSNSDRDLLSRIIFVSWRSISFVLSGPLLLFFRILILQLMVKRCTHDKILRVFFRLNCSSNSYCMVFSKLTAILKISFKAFLSLSDSWDAWIVIWFGPFSLSGSQLGLFVYVFLMSIPLNSAVGT